MSWSRPFSEPVPLPGGGALRTLADARAYILALPESDQRSTRWQNAVEALLLVAAHNGPTMFARIALMQALSPVIPPRAGRHAKKYRVVS